jgi:hypothetical protein
MAKESDECDKHKSRRTRRDPLSPGVMNRVAMVAAMVMVTRLGKCRSRKQQHQRENEQLLHNVILAIARLRIRERLPPHGTLLPEAATSGHRETKATSLLHQTSFSRNSCGYARKKDHRQTSSLHSRIYPQLLSA